VNPDGSSLREIPVTHVLKHLFIHEQRSSLRIYNGSMPIGYLSMYPHIDPDSDARVLDLSGTLQFDLSGRRQRVSWDTVLTMNPAFEVTESEYRIKMHEPADVFAEIHSRADRPLVHVRLTSKNVLMDERDIPLNQSGIEGLAQQFGATGDVLGLVQQPTTAMIRPVIHARQSSLRLGRDQRTETFLVTIEHNGQTYLECHFSQLGQALRAKTLFGYTLQDELLP
jgi:hypothetical protein